MSNKQPRRPAPDILRQSTRVSTTTVSTNDAAQASLDPRPGDSIRQTRVSSKEVPTRRELKLLHAVFTDDEDKTQEFYVADVKLISCPFQNSVFCVCAFIMAMSQL